MTTPTPRTIRLRSGIKTVNGITGETAPTYSEYVLLEDYQRDLAAAQEELVRERMAQTNVEMAHAQEKNELRQQLAAAQEARQAAEEDRDSARDRVKSLVLDLSAAVGRYQRAEERVRELENFADLMADEFQRIVVCCESGDTFVASEIIGLCQRAVKTTKQNVPVIVQRDRAEALAESYKAANAILAHALKHFADESKWGPVADYSAGYWYMTGKPWIPAAKAVEQADAAIAGEPK